MMRLWLCLLLLVGMPLAAQEEAGQPPAGREGRETPVLGQEPLEEPVLEGEDIPDTTKRIYRVFDEKGNPVYTDTPPDDGSAAEVELRQPSILPMGGSRPTGNRDPLLEEPPDVAARYRIRIQSPDDEQTFQNPSEPIMVKVNVTPELEEGAEVQVVADGVPLPGSLATGFAYERPERGQHTLQAQVISGSRVIARSPEVVIYVHQPSVLLPPRQGDDTGGAFGRP